MNDLSNPPLQQIWQWLDQVPDPEIPAISLVDLGVVRELGYDGDTLVVVVTPTYSGCPATSIINRDIEAALRENGVRKLRLERRLTPAWTTDWISEKGREQLRRYGIAPPGARQQQAETRVTTASGEVRRQFWMRSVAAPAPEVSCPRCGSVNTARVSQFGSTPCKANYRCMSCLEPFDYFKRI